MKNKNIKRLLTTTSALVALSLSANVFAVYLGGPTNDVDLTKDYHVTHTSNTKDGEVTLTVDAKETPSAWGYISKSTGVAPVTPATTPAAVPFEGKITLEVNSEIDKKGLKFHVDYLKNVAAVTLKTSGEGYVEFDANNKFETSVSGTNEILGNFTSQVIDASAGNQRIHVGLNATHSTFNSNWVKYGENTKLKIKSTENVSISNGDSEFKKDNKLLSEIRLHLTDTHSLNFDDAEYLKSVVFVNNAQDVTIKGFKDDAVIDSVSFDYEGTTATAPASGNFGKIDAVNKSGTAIDLTVKKLGKKDFAVSEAIVRGEKTLTLGEKDGEAYLNKVTLSYNKSKVGFDGQSLSAVGADAKVTATDIDFKSKQNGMFTVTAKNPELNIKATNAGANQEAKFVVTNGATLVGDENLNFGNGIVEITEGDLLIKNSSATMSIGTVKRSTSDKAATSAGVIVELQSNSDNAILAAANFQFAQKGEKMHLGLYDKKFLSAAVGGAGNIHNVKFSTHEDQVFEVRNGYVKIKPTFATIDSKFKGELVATKGSTLVGGGATYGTGIHNFNAISAGVDGANLKYSEFKKDATKTTFFNKLQNSIKIEDGGALMLESHDAAAANNVPVIVGTVKMAGKAILKSDKNSANSSMILYANNFDIAANTELKIHGNHKLAGYDAKEMKFKSITAFEEDSKEDKIEFYSPVNVAGNVETSVVTNQNFTATKFASAKNDQTLKFSHNGNVGTVVKIKGDIGGGASRYKSVDMTATDDMIYEGKIDATTFTANASDKKSLRLEVEEISADNIYLSSADEGKIVFTKDLDLDSEVYGTAAAANNNSNVNIEFQKVTLKKKFANKLAKVTAKELVLDTAEVTMESIASDKLKLDKNAKMTFSDTVENVKLLELGSSTATINESVMLSEGKVLKLDVNEYTSGKLVVTDDAKYIDLNKAKFDITSKDSDLWKENQKFEFSTAAASITLGNNEFTKSSPFYELKAELDDTKKKAFFKVVSLKDTGDVLRGMSKLSGVGVTADNLSIIADSIKKDNFQRAVFRDLMNATRNAFSEENADFDRISAGAPGSNNINALKLLTAGINSTLYNRLSSASPVAVAAGSPANAEGLSMWGEGMMSSGTQKVSSANAEDADSFTDSSRSLMFGVDYRVSDNSLVGLLIGYSDAEVKYAGHRDKNVDNLSAFAVAAYGSQSFGDFFLSEKLGFSTIEASRSFARVGQEDNAKADSKPFQYFAGMTVGYDVKVSDFITIAPMAKLNFENVLLYNEVESGSKVGNFKIENKDQKSLFGSLGGALKASLDMSEDMVVMPDLHAFINYDLMAKEDSRTIKISSATTSESAIELKASNANPLSWEAGAGLTVKSACGFEFSGRLDGQFKNKYMGVLGSVKVRLEF